MPPLYVASTAVVTFRSSRITGRVLPVSSSALMHSGQVAIAEGRPDEDSQLHLDDGEMPPEERMGSRTRWTILLASASSTR